MEVDAPPSDGIRGEVVGRNQTLPHLENTTHLTVLCLCVEGEGGGGRVWGVWGEGVREEVVREREREREGVGRGKGCGGRVWGEGVGRRVEGKR